MPNTVLNSTVTRPSRPSVERKAKASGMPAKLLATPEKVITAERMPSGSLPRIMASAMNRPMMAPKKAEAADTRIEIENEDFVRTARAKGITERRVLFRHVLRTSMISFVSLLGLDFGFLVAGGALLTEVVFGLPGVGKLTYDSLQNLDLPVIMATVMYAAFFVVLVNAIVDVVYAWLDPRVRIA